MFSLYIVCHISVELHSAASVGILQMEKEKWRWRKIVREYCMWDLTLQGTRKVSTSFTQHLKTEEHTCICPLFMYRYISLSTHFWENTTLQNELQCKKLALQNRVFCGCVASLLQNPCVVLLKLSEKNHKPSCSAIRSFFLPHFCPVTYRVFACTFSLQCDIFKKHQNEIFFKIKWGFTLKMYFVK